MLGISGYQTQRGDTMVLNPAVGATVARPDCPANCVRSRSRSSSGRSQWLRARTDVAGPVALMGVSRGSELALLSASLLDGVDGVVAFAPSGIVWPALGERGPIDALAWTFRGKAVPYVSLGSRLPAHSADTPFASGRGG